MTSVLLRLCLVLMLALGGTGGAWPWASAPIERADASAAERDAAGDCHGHAGADAPAPAPGPGDQPCGREGCDCRCAQHAPAAIALAARRLPTWPSAPPRASPHPPHLSPPAARPIRPPIA